MKQAVAKRKERIFSKDFTLVMTAGTGTAFMNHLFAVALALHIEAIGGLQLHVGILGMVYSLVALVIRPMSGVLSDKYGRVKQLIVGAFLCTVGTFLYGTTALVSLLIVFRAIQGIGFGMHSTMAGAVAADVLPKSRLAEGIGIFGLGATIAMAVGPGLGIFVMGEGELHNFRNLFFLAAGMCAVSTIANSFISYERKRKKAARTASLQAGASGQSKAAATTTSSVP
ncbi:MAG: MFS transporter, partial [Oscillospiraceae bacterium]|nr:MFS transporter [Oscillospiraceae bacterium]